MSFCCCCCRFVMASNDGFLTQEQREQMKIATQNVEMLFSSSPKSPSSLLLQEHQIKVSCGAGAKAPAVGFASRHTRCSVEDDSRFEICDEKNMPSYWDNSIQIDSIVSRFIEALRVPYLRISLGIMFEIVESNGELTY
ncbi:hypothetical protein GIB67_027801 [Kingdonia uniflora]|uniref:Uncharacterized protein n=1 Tax=Kingdonia uniflora TaxID=39325 RepID=A0A7J7PC26_9MAGN|nr:hypothetical protein GIB67_027801 [Kingdonia uniflora]